MPFKTHQEYLKKQRQKHLISLPLSLLTHTDGHSVSFSPVPRKLPRNHDVPIGRRASEIRTLLARRTEKRRTEIRAPIEPCNTPGSPAQCINFYGPVDAAPETHRTAKPKLPASSLHWGTLRTQGSFRWFGQAAPARAWSPYTWPSGEARLYLATSRAGIGKGVSVEPYPGRTGIYGARIKASRSHLAPKKRLWWDSPFGTATLKNGKELLRRSFSRFLHPAKRLTCFPRCCFFYICFSLFTPSIPFFSFSEWRLR